MLPPRLVLALIVVLGTMLTLPAVAAETLPPAWAVAPQRVVDTGTYTEGPVFWNDDLYYVETKVGSVMRLSREGVRTVVVENLTGANGLAVLNDTLIVVGTGGVFYVSADAEGSGTIEHRIEGMEDGTPFVSSNDLLLDGQGGFWFTASGSRTKATGKVFHVAADRSVRELASDIAFANGILRTPDGGTLIVAQSMDNDLLAFDIAADLSLSNRRVLLTLPSEGLDQAKNAPDGLCMSPGGTMFVAHNGMGRVRAFDMQGRVAMSYRTGLLAASNCTFGPDGTLYVTGSNVFETGPGGIERLPLE